MKRDQDDLFTCLTGNARVVVLDRDAGDVFTEDIGEENPVGLYIPGHYRSWVRGSERPALLLPRHQGVQPLRSGRAQRPPGTIRRVEHLEHGQADALRAGRRRRVLITSAGGQLGSALRWALAADDVVALDYADWDVTLPAPAALAVHRPGAPRGGVDRCRRS